MTNQNTNFKWKVVYYSNVNGQEKRIEKEFDNPAEYQNFLQNNQLSLPTRWGNGDAWDSLFDKFFTQKLGHFLWKPSLGYQSSYDTPQLTHDSTYDTHLSEYEAELQKIEQEKAQKEERKSYLQGLIEKLKEYKKRFEEAGLKEKIKDIDADIKEATKELKTLWS